MFKKIMLMATMVAAVAAFVAPTAQATFANSNWAMGAGALTGMNGTIEGTGQLKFNATSGLGGVECHVVIHANLTGSSSTGGIDKFTPSNCMTFGFLATVCGTNVNVTPTFANPEVGWQVHAQKTEGTRRILITEATIDNTFPEKSSNCPAHTINVEGPDATNPVFATPNTPTNATSLILGGEVKTGVGVSKAEGTITLTSGSATYGIL